MEITVRTGDLLGEASDLAMLASFEDEPLPATVAGLLEPADFRGRAKQTVLLYPRGAVAPRRLLLVDLGKREKVTTEMVKSQIADLKNIGGRPAGSITAGAFLAAFVGACPFVHLDIAGTAWVDRPAKPIETQGGTGVGVRLLTEYLRGYR